MPLIESRTCGRRQQSLTRRPESCAPVGGSVFRGKRFSQKVSVGGLRTAETCRGPLGIHTMPLRSCALWAVLLLIATGCGGADKSKANRPKTVPARGVVKLNGQPLAGASIIFSPVEASHPAAMAISGSDGSFVPRSFPPDAGIVPGGYKVVVIKQDESQQKADRPGGHDTPESGQVAKSSVPAKYSDAAKTDLLVMIQKEGDNEVTLDLK